MVAPLFLGVDRPIDAHPLFHQLPDLLAAGIGQLLAGGGRLGFGQLHQIPDDLLPMGFHIFFDTLSLLVHKKYRPFAFCFIVDPLPQKGKAFDRDGGMGYNTMCEATKTTCGGILCERSFGLFISGPIWWLCCPSSTGAKSSPLKDASKKATPLWKMLCGNGLGGF